jgi:hypothetical protein
MGLNTERFVSTPNSGAMLLRSFNVSVPYSASHQIDTQSLEIQALTNPRLMIY